MNFDYINGQDFVREITNWSWAQLQRLMFDQLITPQFMVEYWSNMTDESKLEIEKFIKAVVEMDALYQKPTRISNIITYLDNCRIETIFELKGIKARNTLINALKKQPAHRDIIRYVDNNGRIIDQILQG